MSQSRTIIRSTSVMFRNIHAIALALVTIMATASCAQSPTAPSASRSSISDTALASSSVSSASSAAMRFGKRTPGVVYVTSQNLYYDTFVVKDPLPMEGRFQLLENGQTEFGPGQPGYLGGRWWEDLNENGVQDSADHFFLCPLLPPGRATP